MRRFSTLFIALALGASFAAGCGIVWESDPAAEELESRIKLARWLEMLEVRA